MMMRMVDVMRPMVQGVMSRVVYPGMMSAMMVGMVYPCVVRSMHMRMVNMVVRVMPVMMMCH